ncbi:hypothetical protein EDC01DRAFT_636049 [Geopyxis carbonaria]|nr:hypothetical protein EDC01DRAFT_636049 [Geopyxis carbonaria]
MRLSTSLSLLPLLAPLALSATLPASNLLPSPKTLSTYAYYLALYPLPSCLGVPTAILGSSPADVAAALNTCHAVPPAAFPTGAASVRIYVGAKHALSVEVFRTPQCEAPVGGTAFTEALGDRGDVEGQWTCLEGTTGVVEGVYTGWRVRRMEREVRVEGVEGWKDAFSQ